MTVTIQWLFLTTTSRASNQTNTSFHLIIKDKKVSINKKVSAQIKNQVRYSNWAISARENSSNYLKMNRCSSLSIEVRNSSVKVEAVRLSSLTRMIIEALIDLR